MSDTPERCCGRQGYSLVFACSGAADVGAVSDQAARLLSRERTASMCCGAAMAAEIPDILTKARCASRIVVIDGCDKACAKAILERAGFKDSAHVELGSVGMVKGETPVNEEHVRRAAQAAREVLNAMASP